MKSSLTTPLRAILFQAILIASLLPSSVGDGSLRGAFHQNQTETLENVECTLFLKFTRLMAPPFASPQEEEKWTCEFDFSQRAENSDIHGNACTTVELEGIEDGFLESQGAKSGHSKLSVSTAIFGGSDGKLFLEIPPSASVQVLESPDNVDDTTGQRKGRKLAKTSGTLKTLVVRVISKNGVGPSANTQKLRSDVFEDRLCLKSQYEACSHGRLQIEPFGGITETGRSINGGVVQVQINMDPSYGNRDQLEAMANERATELYGDLRSQFDLVMFSMPPGSGDWLAYAYINRFDSYFNDNWSSSASTQVHEVGHNLGLAHSGKGSNTYGDQSGVMGYSYDMDDAPRMCFNPAKSYQLGWYIEQQKFLNPLTDILAKTSDDTDSREYVLNGVNDFQFGTNGSQDKLVSLRLKQQNSREDFYLGYNRKAGMNSGTVHDANNVVIVKKTGGPIDYGQSWKVATLSANRESYTVKSFDDSSFDVVVELVSIVGKNAKIKVSVTNSAPCHQVRDSTKLRHRNKPRRTCQWVGKRKGQRCSRTWKNKLLSEWCPRSCGPCSDLAAAEDGKFDGDN
jgi:hypothetical protein